MQCVLKNISYSYIAYGDFSILQTLVTQPDANYNQLSTDKHLGYVMVFSAHNAPLETIT